MHSPVLIEDHREVPSDRAHSEENKKTLELMLLHGVNNVRGGEWAMCTRDYDSSDAEALTRSAAHILGMKYDYARGLVLRSLGVEEGVTSSTSKSSAPPVSKRQRVLQSTPSPEASTRRRILEKITDVFPPSEVTQIRDIAMDFLAGYRTGSYALSFLLLEAYDGCVFDGRHAVSLLKVRTAVSHVLKSALGREITLMRPTVYHRAVLKQQRPGDIAWDLQRFGSLSVWVRPESQCKIEAAAHKVMR